MGMGIAKLVLWEWKWEWLMGMGGNENPIFPISRPQVHMISLGLYFTN